MMEVEFTQYMMPNGRKVPVTVEVDDIWEDVVAHVHGSGRRFETEVLTTGEVSFTIFDPDTEEDVWIELSKNGPPVLAALDRLLKGYENEFMHPSWHLKAGAG